MTGSFSEAREKLKLEKARIVRAEAEIEQREAEEKNAKLEEDRRASEEKKKAEAKAAETQQVVVPKRRPGRPSGKSKGKAAAAPAEAPAESSSVAGNKRQRTESSSAQGRESVAADPLSSEPEIVTPRCVICRVPILTVVLTEASRL